MKKIPMLERFAAQSLVEYDGELIFSKEKFAELIVKECADYVRETYDHEAAESIAWQMEVKFGLHGDYA
jgi:hypothetical protein